MPIAEQLAGTLDFEVLLHEFGGLVVVEPVGVLLPGGDLQVEAAWRDGYVGALATAFIQTETIINYYGTISLRFQRLVVRCRADRLPARLAAGLGGGGGRGREGPVAAGQLGVRMVEGF